MTVEIERLRCFIASPSDCLKERKAAAAAVRRIDRLVAERLGFSLKPYGWKEDALPDVGRPQEIINGILANCEVVILVFWHRLGTDAGLGLTGAEEEFHRAIERRYVSGEPRMLLYFKEAEPPKSEVDPVQLARLRAFRQRIDANRKLLYGTFRHGVEWREYLEDALADELFRRLPKGWRSGSPGEREREGEKGTVDSAAEQTFLLDRMIHNLEEQVARLRITNEDPRSLAHLKTEIERLERIRDGRKDH